MDVKASSTQARWLQAGCSTVALTASFAKGAMCVAVTSVSSKMQGFVDSQSRGMPVRIDGLLAPELDGATLAGFGAAETGAAVPAGTRQRQPGR
jgi:hypothetical protein